MRNTFEVWYNEYVQSLSSNGYHSSYKSHTETLKAKGVTELAIYQKGKRIMVPLPV